VRRAAHRDKSEPGIVEALRGVGAHVFKLSGAGVPDLLVYFRGRWMPLEVKTPKRDRLRGGDDVLTAAQKVSIALAPYPVVETPEQALRTIGAIR